LREHEQCRLWVVMQDWSAATAGFAVCERQGALVIYPIFAFGSEEQKRTWLPRSHEARRSAASALPSPIRLRSQWDGNTRATLIKAGCSTVRSGGLRMARCRHCNRLGQGR
jgi:alkylation response protein AidB-like acyl-CoA dehydrogenase